MGYRVGVVGATGLVGGEMLRMLEQRAFPVDELALEREEALGKRVRPFRAHKKPAVISQKFRYVSLRVPAQTTPYDLVDVVVAAFRICDESSGVAEGVVENRRLIPGPRIDGLAV